MSSLRYIFSLVCGQQHNWVLGGQPLPFCQRCTGLYVGVVFAFAMLLLFRPRPTNRMLWLHGLFLLQMIPFGYHLLPQTAEMRMLTGQLFAVGLAYYLVLLPGDRWSLWHNPVLRSPTGYFAATGTVVILLLVAVIWGGSRTNAVLSTVGVAGLLLCLALVLLNLALLALSTRAFLRRCISSLPS